MIESYLYFKIFTTLVHRACVLTTRAAIVKTIVGERTVRSVWEGQSCCHRMSTCVINTIVVAEREYRPPVSHRWCKPRPKSDANGMADARQFALDDEDADAVRTRIDVIRDLGMVRVVPKDHARNCTLNIKHMGRQCQGPLARRPLVPVPCTKQSLSQRSNQRHSLYRAD